MVSAATGTPVKIPYTITSNSISVLLDSKMRIVASSNPVFGDLRAALRSGAPLDDIRGLVDIPTFYARKTFGRVQIGANEVRFDGDPVHSAIADRLIEFITAGDDVEPLALFLDRLMNNPLQSARDDLYAWLQPGNAPFTPDGCFLAFKAVRHDYKDKRTGTFDNSVGRVVSMPREQVDPDRTNECSRGLHFCSHGYLGSFASGNDRVVIVKIDPADVVAIPTDYNRQKGRAWRYEVVGELEEGLARASTHFDGTPLRSDYQGTVVGADEEEDNAGVVTEDEDYDYGYYYVDDSDTGNADAPVYEEDTVLLVFTSRDGREFTADEVAELLEEHGQRGASRLTGVPRTTLQEWAKAIREYAT